MVIAYLILLFSMSCEVFAASLVTSTHGFTKLKPTVACIILYTFSYVSFGFALIHIDLGIAYATWGAVGIIVTTIVGYMYYKHRLTKVGYIALVAMIISTVSLNLFG